MEVETQGILGRTIKHLASRLEEHDALLFEWIVRELDQPVITPEVSDLDTPRTDSALEEEIGALKMEIAGYREANKEPEYRVSVLSAGDDNAIENPAKALSKPMSKPMAKPTKGKVVAPALLRPYDLVCPPTVVIHVIDALGKLVSPEQIAKDIGINKSSVIEVSVRFSTIVGQLRAAKGMEYDSVIEFAKKRIAAMVQATGKAA